MANQVVSSSPSTYHQKRFVSCLVAKVFVLILGVPWWRWWRAPEDVPACAQVTLGIKLQVTKCTKDNELEASPKSNSKNREDNNEMILRWWRHMRSPWEIHRNLHYFKQKATWIKAIEIREKDKASMKEVILASPKVWILFFWVSFKFAISNG